MRYPVSRARRLRAALSLLLLSPGIWSVAAAPTGAAVEPFAPRSAPRGGTLFTALPPEATGIVTENRYSDPTMWWERYQEFTVGPIGTGVAAGDFDGDGWPDLFVVSKTESCRLFRNRGGWRFEDVTERAGVADRGADAAVWKQGAAFVDVDNDGRLDLYVCRFGAPNRLYMNRGDGTFREEAAARGLALADASGMAAFADYDRDGWLDMYLQTNLLDARRSPAGQRDRLFRNLGGGRFAEVTDAAGIRGETQGHSATWWDFDEDGWPDLYVANDFAMPDQLYHNQRDGTFRNVAGRVLPSTPYSSMGADLGDVDNDGRIDLLVADMAATAHPRDQRGMADSRTARRDPKESPEEAPQILRNMLFLNTGLGRCEEAAHLAGIAATDWTWSVRFEDLDNDGRLDLHVTNGMVRELHNLDLLGRMMVAESPQERIRIMQSSPVLNEANLAYRNRGDLDFEEVGAAWGLNQRGVSFGAAFADFDRDGDLDLVYTNFGGPVTVLRNDADGGNAIQFALQGTASNRFGVGATVRIETEGGVQVRQLVLARGYGSTSEPVLHFGLGAETRVRRVVVRWPSGRTQVRENLEAGRRHLLVEPETAGPAIVHPEPAPWWREDTAALGLGLTAREAEIEETAAQPLLPFRHNRYGPALAAMDLDGDGRDDLLLGGTTLDAARRVLRGENGRPRIAPLGLPPASREVNDGPLLVLDADGDGRPDGLVTKGGVALPAGVPAYQPLLVLDLGGTARLAGDGAWPPFPGPVGAVAAADFDRDGTLEVFLGGRVVPGHFPVSPRSVLLARRGGEWTEVTLEWARELAEAGMVTAALASDVDGDGWTDLLVAHDWGPVRYWRNIGGRRFEDRSAEAGFAGAGEGAWSGLAAADFNRDGRLDYVAGNLGSNTPYQASAERPAEIYLGDFRPGHEPVLVEALVEGGRRYPQRTLKQLTPSLPALRRTFPRNNDFARATLEQVVGAAPLAAARRWQLTEVRSGVFLSQPDGTRRFVPLPHRAQLAPWQGVVAGDFDGDGRADIVAAQNSRAPVPSIGRFEGGLGVVLRGDGEGGFEALPPRRSGWIVPGDARAVVRLHLDGDGAPDLVVSRNDASLLAFRATPPKDGRFLTVALTGLGGNPDAVGARVVVEDAAGRRTAHEVQAGGGGAGQSASQVVIGYRVDRPPAKLRVEWPGGRATEQAFPAGRSRLSLAEPRG